MWRRILVEKLGSGANIVRYLVEQSLGGVMLATGRPCHVGLLTTSYCDSVPLLTSP